MPIEFDGPNSKVSANAIEAQSGSTITIQSGHNLSGGGSGLTALNAANLASGTLPMARLSGTLPALNGSALTALNATNLASGTIPIARLGNDVIDSQHYAAASIDNEHLADDAVGVAELSATGTASSSTFLRGDNAWAEAGGGLVFLGSTTSGSQRDYTSQITGTYDHYLMVFQLLGDNAGNNMAIQVYASSSLITSSSYAWNTQVGESDTASISGSASNGDDMIRMAKSGQQNASPLVGHFYFHRNYGLFNGMLTYKTATGYMAFSTFGGTYTTQSAINGIRLLMDGGIFQGGTARLYGVVNA